jgi:hypothetical protein
MSASGAARGQLSCPGRLGVTEVLLSGAMVAARERDAQSHCDAESDVWDLAVRGLALAPASRRRGVQVHLRPHNFFSRLHASCLSHTTTTTTPHATPH